jgi:hypothetical protein
MDSLDEHKVYQVQKGRVLHDDDEPVPDAIAIGLYKLTEGMNNPLNDYNAAFHRLQKRRKMKPASSKDIPTSVSETTLNDDSTVLNPPATPGHPSPTNFVQSDTALETVDEEEMLEEEKNEDETLNEVYQILNDMENGQIDESLPRLRAEDHDVAFDMDEVVMIEEEDHHTDGTSDSDNSGSSSEDSMEDIYL